MDLGTAGVFRRWSSLSPELAVAIEALGYGTIWIGGSPAGDLAVVEKVLAATGTVKVATGIVNIWKDAAEPVAASYHRLEERYPGRFLLGLGVGHPESIQQYAKPYEAMVSYLDALDAGGVPRQRRVLAALAPRMLRLSAARTLGAHPYLVTPEHSRRAREILGPGVLLAPEQRVVLDADPARVRLIGRPTVARPYLELSNYRNNLLALGFEESDLASGGSDRLVDALVVSGAPQAAAARLAEHLDAGADHVAVNVITDDSRDPLPDLTALAEALHLEAR